MFVILSILGLLYAIGARVTTLQFVQWWGLRIEKRDPTCYSGNKSYKLLRDFDEKHGHKPYGDCISCKWSMLPGYPHQDCLDLQMEVGGAILNMVTQAELLEGK